MRGGAPLRAGDGGSGATDREATPGLRVGRGLNVGICRGIET